MLDQASVFTTIPSEEYQMSKINTNLKTELLNNVLTIITLEQSDYHPTANNLTKYKFGSQLIFIDSIWANTNMYKIGLIFPAAIVVKIIDTNFCYFQNEELTNKLHNLASTNYLIIPINDISFKREKLKTTALPITKQRYKYSRILQSRQLGDRRNTLYLNYSSLGCIALFLFGIHITESNLSAINNFEKLSLPSQNIVKSLANHINSFSKSINSNGLGGASAVYNITSINNIIRYLIPAEDYEFWLYRDKSKISIGNKKGWFSRGGSNYSPRDKVYSVYANVLQILWSIQHELTLINIKDMMEVEDI